MTKTQNTFLKLFIAFLGLAILFNYAKQPFQNPDAFWWNNGSDPLKSYYLPAYYMKYDTGYMSTGFNYPYGEHAVYADIQPGITFPLNWIDNHIVSIHQHFNWLFLAFLFGSVVVAAVLLYKILRIYGLSDWWALVGAILITWLSPQWDRLPAHYGLSYMWVIPAAWYFLIRAERSAKPYGWIALLSTTILFSGLLHMYNTLIVGFFVGAYALIGFIQKRSDWKKYLAFILACLIPIVSVPLFLKFTDPFAADRPIIPWGFYEYMSEMSSVFLPQVGPVRPLVEVIITYPETLAEGWGYVGMVAVLTGIVAIARILYRLKNKRFARLLAPSNDYTLNRALLAAIGTLMFSMGVPFIWGFDFLLDWLPQLKQFRSLGRFSWVFYYVFTVFIIRYLYLVFKSVKAKGLNTFVYSFLSLCVVFWALEGHINIRNKTWAYSRAKDIAGISEFDYTQLLKEKSFAPSDFQAVLFLPYAHTGSEKLSIHRSDPALRQGVYCSYQTGLPIITTFSARTSLSQSLKLIQLLSDPAIDKEVIAELPNQKPILLIVTGENMTRQEQRLINSAQYICSYGHYSLLALPITAFNSTRTQHLNIAQSATFSSLNDDIDIHFPDSIQNSPVITGAYTDLSSNETLTSKQFCAEKVGEKYELELYNGTLQADSTYLGRVFEFGIWTKCDNQNPFLPTVIVEVYSPENELIETKQFHNFVEIMHIYKHWALHLNEFLYSSAGHRYRIYMQFGSPFVAGNLMIKPQGEQIYLRQGKHFYFNYFPLN